ncbi:hypothetical protein J6590_025121 [Homalodisca vitripennis]|nr:hypothetical protein J6590_025121 [Homalodisca vitripennis]
MKLITYELEITIPVLKKSIKFGINKSLKQLLLLAGVTSSTPFIFKNNVQTMYDFVQVLQNIMVAVTILVLLLSLFGRDTAKEYFELLSKSDLNHHTSTRRKSDGGIFWFFCLGVGYIIFWIMYIIQPPVTATGVSFSIGCVVSFLHGLEITIMKYIVVKQLRCTRSWARSSATVEKLISNTRQILGGNSSINCADGPTVTFLEGLAFLSILRHCYSCWMFFYAHVELFAVRNLFLVRSCLYLITLFMAFLLAVLSSMVNDEVGEIKMQLDITWTALPCTRKQQKMMSLFILELYHSPVELSALGFFDINRPTLVSALSIIISCIQPNANQVNN